MGEASTAVAVAVLAFTTLQRVFELVYARRNERRLKERGAYEWAPEHYPAIVALHAAWLAGLWLGALHQPVNVYWLFVFAALQALRAWVLVTLKDRWTTRILVLPGAPLVRSGPYRFLSHPNYVVVAGEILALPCAFGLYAYAAVFTVLNAGILAIRVPAEERALSAVAASAPRESSPAPDRPS